MRHVVLDTDVASLILKKRLPATLTAKLTGARPVLTFVGRAELLKWTYARDWSTRNRAGLVRWMSDVPLLAGESAVADVYGAISAAAMRLGRPRPMNDMWTAACCLVHRLPLATMNVKDFDYFRAQHGLTIVTA